MCIRDRSPSADPNTVLASFALTVLKSDEQGTGGPKAPTASKSGALPNTGSSPLTGLLTATGLLLVAAGSLTLAVRRRA